MTAIQYFIQLISGAVNALKGLSLAPLGLPNINMLQVQVALLVGFTGLALLGKDDDDYD